MRHQCLGLVAVLVVLVVGTGVALGATGFSGDSTINRCETKSYTLNLENTSGNDLTDLVLTAKLVNLPEFSYIADSTSIDINGGGAFCTVNPALSGTDLIWDIDGACPGSPITLNNSDTLNITFDLATTCTAVSGSLNARVDYELLGAPDYDDTAVLNIQVNPGAVTIKKEQNVIPQVLGGNATWTLTVENTGFGVIENVEVTDVMGAGLAYVSSTQSGNNSGQTTTWTSAEYAALASMDPGDILTLDITATVIACDNLDNTADVSFGCAAGAGNACFDTSINGGTANASVQRIVRTPLITFTPPDISFTYCDDTENFAFTITNIGDGIAYDVYTIVDFTGFTVSNVSVGAIYNVAQQRFELSNPLAASGGTYNLSFDLTYDSWCGSFPSRDLLWQKLYKDECGQEFYPPVELSTINAPSSSSSLAVSKSGAPSQIEIGETITYTITSSYSGQTTCDSPSNNVGLITVVDTIPAGLTVTDAGGGVWVPGSGGTGGTITWTYTPPASLNTTITVQIPDISQCEAFCNTIITNNITASGTDCCGCALSASDSQTTAIECAEGVTSDKTSTSPTERCDDTTYTNTYVFSGGSGVNLNDLIFTEQAENLQVYNGGLSIDLDGNPVVGVTLTDTTPGGTVELDFTGTAATPLAGSTLVISYDLTATESTVAACAGSTFYSWSSLDMGPSGSSCLGDGIIHETTEVTVGSPGMSLSLTGLGQIYNTCETKTITMELTQTSNYNPKDAKVVLEGLKYFVVNPASVTCGGSVAPVSCTPVIDGSGDYVWTFNDGFTANGSNARFTIDVQKRCTGDGELKATAYFDDRCTDDATPDELCSVVATETPALLLIADLLIEKTPETYYATTDMVQWEIYVTNRGTGTAYNVWVDDVLGSGLQYQHGVNPVMVDDMTGVTVNDSLNHLGGAINGASVLIAEMAAGERRQITFIAKQIDCINLTNDVTTNWGCVGVSCQTEVTDSSIVQIPAPNLINTNTITPANGIDACEDPKGFITLRNAGQVYTYNLQVTETLPANLAYVSGSTRWRVNGGAWNGPNVIYDPLSTTSPLVWDKSKIPQLASAAPADTIEIEFDMVSNCTFAGGDITVSTQYENPCADVFTTTESIFTLVFNKPDVDVTKTRVDEPINCGETIFWNITVTNNSGYTLENIWVVDELDAAYDYVSTTVLSGGAYIADTGDNPSSGQIVNYEIRSLPAGQKVELRMQATDNGSCSSDIDNTVTAFWGCGNTDGSSTTKPGLDAPDVAPSICLNGSGETYTREETRRPSVDFQGNIGLNPASIDSCNDSTEMTVTLSNTGPTDSYDLDLVITLPANLTYNSNSAELCIGVDDSCTPTPIGNPSITSGAGGTTILSFFDRGDKANDLADLLQADGGSDTIVLKFDVQTSCYTTADVDFDLYYYDCCGLSQYTVNESITLTADYPQLAITKTPATGQIDCTTGSQEWVFTVTNNGTGNAQVVRVEDTPGAWLTMQLGTFNDVDGTGATIAALGGGVYGWEFTNLAAGNSVEFRVSTQLIPDYGLPVQANCNEIYRQNDVSAVWGCGTGGDATDLNATTTGYDCQNPTSVNDETTLELPNLVVTSITPAINCTTGDGVFSGTVTVRVTNNGDDDTSVPFTVQVNDGKTWTGTGIHSNVIAAGAFADVIIDTATWNPVCQTCGAGGDYSFVATVDINDDICECNESDNDNAGSPTSFPTVADLKVNTITPTCSGDGLSQVVVNVGNVGCSNASSAFVVHLEDDQGNSSNETVTSLNAGSNTDVTFSNWPTVCTPARINFTATVDNDDDICECSSDNSLTQQYDNASADLTVTTVTPAVTCTNDGTVSGAIVVQVANDGNGAVSSDFQILVDDGQGGTSEPWYQADLGGTLPLGNGASDTVSIDWNRSFTNTPYVCSFPSLSVTVDSQGDICECNNGNNNFTTNYTVPMPDLEITAVTPGSGCPLSGTTVSVENSGCGNATGVVVRLSSDCGLIFADQTVDLAAGATADLVFPFTGNLTGSTCLYSAEIDPDDSICELEDGTNNDGSNSANIDTSDIEVVSSDLQFMCIGDGSYEVGGEVTLINNGYGSAVITDIPMRFSIRGASGCGGAQLAQFTQVFTGVNLTAAGGTQTFILTTQQIQADLCTQAGGCQYSMQIEANYDDTICELDNTNNELCADITVQVPDLTISGIVPDLTCNNDQQVQGVVTVDVANNGCGAVSGAIVELSSNCGTDYESQTIDLAAETVSSVVFPVTNTTRDCLDFTATIDGLNAVCECLGDNNQATATTSVTCEPKIENNQKLGRVTALRKTNSPKAVLPGSIVDYTLHITNAGSNDAVNVEISDTLPIAMIYANGTSALNGNLLADPEGERVLIWTLPRVAAGETAILTYRTVVRSDAKAGRYINTAQVDGGVPASASVNINDPDDAQCCLSVEKEMTAHDVSPDGIRVVPDLYFQTDMAMFASAEFVRLNNELLPWLEKEGLDHDANELVTGLYRRLMRQADWYAHFNLGNVTMGSGLGLTLKNAPDVITQAKRLGKKPAEVVSAKLERWAYEAGLEEVPVVEPLLLEYYAGAPYYMENNKNGSRSWDSHDRDSGLVPSAWAMTLLRQSQAIHQRLKGNIFMSRMTIYQMVQKVKWIHQNLTRTVNSPVAISYLPHRLKIDENQTFPDQGDAADVAVTLEDDSSYLLDQAAALWGLSSMRTVFKQYDFAQPQELTELIDIVWTSLEELHLDLENGIYKDRFELSNKNVGHKDNQDAKVTNKQRIEPFSLMFLALALEDVIRDNDDLAFVSTARKRLEQLQKFVAEKMITEQGVARAYDLGDDSGVQDDNALVKQFALMRILLIQPPLTWLQQLGGEKRDLESVLKLLDFVETKLWDDHLGIYRDNDHWDNHAHYSPFDIGTVVGALRELVQQVPLKERTAILNRLAAVFEKLVDRSEMQLVHLRRSDPDRPLPASIDAGRTGKRPLPLPPRRNNISQEHDDSGDLAPVLIRGINLYLSAGQYQETARENQGSHLSDYGANNVMPGVKQRPTLTPQRPFLTATGLLGSRHLLEAATVLSRTGDQTDDAYLVDPSLSKHFAKNLEELTRAGLIRLTMHSGNGMPLRYSQVLGLDENNLSKSLQDRFNKLALQAGLEKIPVVPNPIGLEYSVGLPHYRNGLNNGWEQRNSDPRISVAGLAQTMLQQLRFIHLAQSGKTSGQADLDKYLASIMGLQVKTKAEFLQQLMDKVQGEIPETVQLIVDSYGYPLDIDFTGGNSTLLTHISLMQAFGELSFMDTDQFELLAHSQALVSIGQSLFKDQWSRTMAALDLDKSGMLSQVKASNLETGLALDAIARLSQMVSGESHWKQKINKAGNILARRIEEQQLNSDNDKNGRTVEKSDELAGRSALIIGLGHWFEITAQHSNKTAVLEMYQQLILDFWDPELGIFHNSVDMVLLQNTGVHRYRYSDLDIGLTLSALINTLPYLETSLQREAVDRLIVFAHEVLEGIGLDFDHFAENRLANKTYDIELLRGVDLLVNERRKIYPGEIVTFSIYIKNSCLDPTSDFGALNQVTVHDRLPQGMSYVAGSSWFNNKRIDPRLTNSGELSWTVGEFGNEEAGVLTFSARVLEQITFGDDYNSAWAKGWSLGSDSGKNSLQQWSCQTGEDRLFHTVGPLGKIEGRVFLDTNQDKRQGAAEVGFAGIGLFLDGQLQQISEGDGGYSYELLRPGVYDVRLDWQSLPPDVKVISDPVNNVVLHEGEKEVFNLALLKTHNVESFVYYDSNSNGIRDHGEPGVGAIKIDLQDSKRFAFSAKDGFVRIDAVPVGVPIELIISKQQPYMNLKGWKKEQIKIAPWQESVKRRQ